MTFWGIIITETIKYRGEKSGMSGEKMVADQNLFPGVRVVLVEPSHPGNIGASARAMKNMGLKELVLVNPFSFPSPQADARAGNAKDVLSSAEVVSSIDKALENSQLIIGTSARSRRISWPNLSPKECADQVVKSFAIGETVSLVFGRESKGLTNNELQKCHFHVNIPTGVAYSSLNLGMAVQVICYEILQAMTVVNDEYASEGWDIPKATASSIEYFFSHLESTLIDLDFHDPENPRQLMTRLRRLFNRIRMDQMEVNILRGFLSKINDLKKQKKK